jgi:beta-glucanase (GH16 family)
LKSKILTTVLLFSALGLSSPARAAVATLSGSTTKVQAGTTASTVSVFATLGFTESLSDALLVMTLTGPDGVARTSTVKMGAVTPGARNAYSTFSVPSTSPSGAYEVSLKLSAKDRPAIEVSGLVKPVTVVGAPAPIVAVSPLNHPSRLTFNDEFKGALDRRIWTPGMASTGVPNSGEIQWYTPDEVEALPGGGLRLRGDRRSFRGKGITAGAVTSAEGFSQRYGHFEIKAKMPVGPGTWPAFWLLASDNSWPPEIDVFENLGRYPTQPHMGYFWALANGAATSASTYASTPNLSAAYHVYAVDWRPEAIVFSIDGREVFRGTANIPDKPMYMLINLAFGGSWAGPVTADTQFPSRLDVAYVRVFQYLDQPAEPVRFIQLGKGALDTRVARPGQTLKYSASIKIGARDVKGLTIHVIAADFGGNNLVDVTVKAGDQAAGAVVPFTAEVPLPTTLANGIYNIKVTAGLGAAVDDPVSTTAMWNIYRGLADQFTVGQPLPPLPAIQ